MEPVVIMLSMFAAIAAIVLLPQLWRSRERQQALKIFQSAVDKGEPVPPELMETIRKGFHKPKVPTRRQDMRRAAFLIAISLGIIAFGWLIYAGLRTEGEEEAIIPGLAMTGIATIPGFVGIAYLILGLRSQPELETED